MPGTDNLIPITTKEQAKELGSKGGKSKSLAKKLINRKFCNSSCPLFKNCWAKHTSFSVHKKAVEVAASKGWPEENIKKLKVECALKNLPTQVIEGAKRIILDGEEGFDNEMMEQVMRLKNDLIIANTTPRLRERYLLQLRETKKSIYGDKSRVTTDDKKGLTADDFANAYDEHKKKSKNKESDKSVKEI